MIKINSSHNLKNKRGFTLIEIIIYCAIFVTFAVVAIESMIWINSKMSLQDRLSEIRNQNIYKIYFANIYKRHRINNSKIENNFKELITSTSSTTPLLKEDEGIGIVLNQTKVQDGEKNKNTVTLFDSILMR